MRLTIGGPREECCSVHRPHQTGRTDPSQILSADNRKYGLALMQLQRPVQQKDKITVMENGTNTEISVFGYPIQLISALMQKMAQLTQSSGKFQVSHDTCSSPQTLFLNLIQILTRIYNLLIARYLMSQQQQTIKWGDIIRIHGVSTNRDKQAKGLIISKGFTDPNVYYQTYENYDQVNFYRESLFQMLPKSNFDLHDQLLNDQNLKEQQKDALKERAKEEIVNLENTLLNKYNDPEHPQQIYVTYGSEVVFKHIESGEYLSGVLKAADIGQGAFKLELVKELSSFLYFRIISHRSYEELGNKIYYDDCLRLHHTKSDCYMNFPDTDISIIFDRPYEVAQFDQSDPGYEYSQNRPSIKKPINRRINVINQNKSKCLWKFILHCRFEDSKKKDKIKSHDIVYFQHTKNKGLIASTLANQRYYLKELKDTNEQSVSYECFWELIPKEGNEFGPETCNLFWARNIVTGQILKYEGYNVEIQSKEQIENGGFKSEGLVNLICAVGEQDQKGHRVRYLLERGEMIPNADNVDEVVRYFDENIRKIDFKKVEQLSEDSFIIVRVSEETILDVSYVLSSQQAFVKVVEIISTELKKKNSDSNVTWKDMFLNLNEDLLVSFISVLKLLIGKIYGTEYKDIESSGNSPILQVQKILVETGIAQLIIELIFTLYDPFQEILSNKDFTEDRAIRLKISQIFELSYILVQKIVKDFLENKIYFSRWIKLFLQQSNNINKPFIQQCLVNILQNNPVSIRAMITEKTIDELINYFFEEAAQQNEGDLTTKHLRLFSTFIRGDDVIFKENQKKILSGFFMSQLNNWNFKFKVEYRISQAEDNSDDFRDKERNKVVKVIFGGEDPCTLPEFYERYTSKFNYLMSYINLLADVCMDRNNQAYEYVETNVPLAVVSTILFDHDIKAFNEVLKQANDSQKEVKRFPNTNIHEPFIRIAHHAYVNNFNFSPIRRIRKIVKWYRFDEEKEISEVEDITKTKRVYEGEKEEEEKTYLKYLLAYIKNFLENYDKDACNLINNLQLLYTVLNFLKETIILGLWESIDEFRQIIPLLIKNITKIQGNIFFEKYEDASNRYNGKEWVDLNKEKLRMNRPEIALQIQCKIKATEIFKYMNEMEIDIRLRYMMNFFQGIYEATENFENYSQSIEDELQMDENEEERDNIINRNSHAKEEFYKIFGTNILGEIKKVSEDQDLMLKEYIWFNKIRTMIPLVYEKTEEPDKDRDLFKHTPEDYPLDNIVLSLFELSGYLNKSLLNNSLKMLRAMFEQRSDLIQSFKDLLICGKGNLNEVYSNLKFMRNKFAMLKNDTIIRYDGIQNKSFAYAIFKPYDHLGREEDKRSGIIQDLFFLARTLKDNVSLKNIESLMFVEKQVFDKSIVYHFYNQKQKNNGLFQQLNMAEGIYDPLLEYIKIIGKQELPEIHRWLLFSIYQYLTLLCFNNMKAKHIFMEYIPYIIPHLNKRVGAANFLYEVCINNKILVNNQQIVQQIIEGALNSCIELEQEELIHGIVSNAINQDLKLNNNFEKSRILYCLRGILIFNDQGHKRNQQILMNRLQDNKFRRLVFSGHLNYTAKKEEFNLNPGETYATTHFQLFSALVESQNLINIGKLENLHPYTYCLERLSQTNRWQIRRALRSYVNRLYYVHKDRDIFLFEEFIRKEFTIINRELLDLIQLHRSKMLTEDLKVKNGIRFVFAQSEIILLIIEILITLHEIFLKPLFMKLLRRELGKEEKLQDQNRKLHPSLIKLLKNLGCIEKLYHNTKTIVSFVREIKKLMEAILLTFHVRYLEKMSEPDSDQSQKEEEKDKEKQPELSKKTYAFDHSRTFFRNLVEMIKFLKHAQTHEKLKEQYLKRKNQMDVSQNDLKKKYIDAIFAVPGENLRPVNSVKFKEQEELHYKPHLQTANSKIFKVLAKPQLQENEENLQLNTRLNNVKQLLTDSPVFKKLKQDEFYKLVHIFISMDDVSSTIYSDNWKVVAEQPRPVFSKKEIIKNCFSLIINYPDQVTDSQKIFIIKLVRSYISEAVQSKQNHKLSVDKWNADYYTDDFSGADPLNQERSELVKRQHEIEECGGSKLLLCILKENLFGKTELLNQTLLLGIVYLFNGNTHCQNSLLTQLLTDPQNITFTSLKHLIKNIGNFLIQVRKFKENEKKRVFSYKIVDSYDHFDSKENILVKMFGHKTDKFQIDTQLNYQLALCRIFRFLQLFCENNNIEMKKFLMSQRNDDGTEKITSINFIMQACLLLRQFFKIMSSKVVNIPPSLLDFINQITQIPCLDCQKSLMRSTFFEDISYMAGFFESKENIEQRKFSFFIDTSPHHDQDQPAPAQEEDPLSTLMQIYEKGVGLALSNFEGNDNQIFWQFLNKCQAKFLWIVIRQNMVKLLRPKAARFGVSRDQVQKQIEKEYMQATQNKEQKRLIYQQYRQFLVEYAFIRKIFACFNEREINRFINEQKAKGETYCQEIINIINVLAILRKIDDYAEKRERAAIANPEAINIDENTKALKARNFRNDLWKYAHDDNYPHIELFTGMFEQLILSIEISSDNGEVVGFQNLYFPNHPVFSYLAADTKDTIMFQVSRQTRRDKLTTLFDYYGELKEEIQSNYKLKYYTIEVGSISFPFSITSELIDQIRKVARYISYLICALMLMLIMVEHDTVQQASYFNFFHYNEKMFMRVLRTLQLLLTLLFFTLWIKMRYSLSMSKLNSQEAEGGGEEQEKQEEEEEEETNTAVPGSLIQKVFYYAVLVQKFFFKFMSKLGSVLTFSKDLVVKITSLPGFRHIGIVLYFFLNPIYQLIKSILIGFSALNKYESGFLSILIFVMASIMGNFVGVEWYVIHLFDYFVGISLLTNVFKAVIDNIGELSLLSAFAGCFILVFNIVSLNTYTPVIFQDDLPAEVCEDVIGCVLTVYTSGAIGDDMDDLYGDRFFFDTVYFIFMEILFSNLVSGIMIDGFGGLKEADNQREQDKKSKCYICSMEKPDIEKTGTTFKKHTEKHFLWSYLFYRYVIEMKDPSDYTGLEYTISTQIDEKKVEWFPDNGPKEEGGEMETLMGNIKDQISKMSDQVKTLLDKNAEEVKSSTKAIEAGMEKISSLGHVQPAPQIPEVIQ